MNRKKKILYCTVCFLIFICLVAGIALRRQIQTISSIEKVTDNFYKIAYTADYKLDKLLEQGVSTEAELEAFISKNLFFGYPMHGNEEYYAGGCTAFSVMTPDSQYISGKNFDYDPTEILIVYTSPQNGYASYTMVDLDIVGIGKDNDISTNSLLGKIGMLAAPYLTCEGMNEKGLFIGIEELETEAIHQDNGKTDLLLTIAVKAMLDKCATVNDCINFLNNYDIHTPFGTPFHLLISDTGGNRVVVEWIENQMNILETNYCTNFQLSQGTNYWVGIGQDRYETVKKKLEETDNILTAEEAMQLLEAARVEWNGEWDTEWSVVYNQSDFSVNVCVRMDYENVYHLAKEDFGY